MPDAVVPVSLSRQMTTVSNENLPMAGLGKWKVTQTYNKQLRKS